MKINKDFCLRNVCGHNLLVNEGSMMDFSKIMQFNESAEYIWNKVGDKDFTKEELVKYLLEEYKVSEEKASKDIDELLEMWVKQGIVIP